MNVTFYGVRGSYNCPTQSIDGKVVYSTMKYGGSTTCVSIWNKHSDGNMIERIIIDSGRGIVQLGKEMVMNKDKEDFGNIKIFFTHLHPDHTTEFPFFAPNYIPGTTINLYGMQALKNHVGKILERNMLPPNFPIEYKDLISKRKHYIIKGRESHMFDTMVVDSMLAYAPSHPQQGAMYYRITDKFTGRSVTCVWDHESKQGGDKAVIKFAKDTDILIHDTQYTEEEYMSESFIVQGFGHSTYDMAIENAEQAKVKGMLICTHFNPAHDDEKLDAIQNDMRNREAEVGFQILLAQEGMTITV